MLTGTIARLSFLYVVVLGACVGSFLNVVIARLPHSESLVKPRSRCPGCGHAIAWYDNIPIVSYVLLRARCRNCKTPISLRYPLVETLVAGLYGALFVRFGLSTHLIVWLPVAAALVAITFLDIDHWWVPDVITFPGMVYVFATSFLPDRPGPLFAVVGVAPAMFLLVVGYAFEKLAGKEGLGLGDVKLLAFVGLALGVMDTFTALLLAALQGAIVGTLVIAAGGHKSTAKPMPQDPDDDWVPDAHAVPFGPFIALGTLQTVLLPDFFNGWHTRLAAIILRWAG